MKRVFLLFSLMIGFLSMIQAAKTDNGLASSTLTADVEEDCLELNCDAIRVILVTGTTASFIFEPVSCDECAVPYYNIGWRRVGSLTWNYGGTSVAGSSGEGTISGLQPCTMYEFVIELKCNGSHLGTTVSQCVTAFVTAGCTENCWELDCDAVEIVLTSNTHMEFAFEPIDCPICPQPYYNIGWRVSGTTEWNYGNTSVSGGSGSGEVSGLSPCTEYEFIIELKCNGTYLGTTISECITSFKTAGCPPACLTLNCNAVAVTSTSNTGMHFSFAPVTCPECPAPYYNVGWRVAGTSTWNYGGTSVAPGAGTGTIFGLQPCRTYEFIIELKCNGSHLGTTVSFCTGIFATTGCPPDCFELDCDAVEVTSTSTTGMHFSFDPITCPGCAVPYYNIGWRVEGASTWNYGGTTVAPAEGTGTIFGLQPCRRYEFIIELKCNGSHLGTTLSSCTGVFVTAGCPPDCFELDCDAVEVTSTSTTGMHFSFDPITCPGCAVPYYNIGWRVEGASTWNYGGTTVAPAEGTGTIFGLQPCRRYEFIIELKCNGSHLGTTLSSCTGVFVTAGCPPDCFELDCTAVAVTSTSTTGMHFSFEPITCPGCLAPYYNVGWRVAGTSTWNYGGTTVAPAEGTGTIFGLSPCTQYEFVIELKCNGSHLGVTLSQCTGSFTTAGCDPSCTELNCDAVQVVLFTSTGIRFVFEPISNCPECPNPYYNIGWRLAGTLAWNYGGTSVSPSGGFGTIKNLQPCRNYEFIIELKCNGTWQGPTISFCIESFTMPGNCSGNAALGLQSSTTNTTPSAYPNPANNVVNILIGSDQEAEGVIRIYNSLGAVVKQINAQTNVTTEVSLQELVAGVYHYTFVADNDANLRAGGKLVIVK